MEASAAQASVRTIVALCHALLVIAAATTANASILTYTNANCTSFTVGGVAPNQTLYCVGVGVGGNPTPLTLLNMNCSSYTLGGVAPNQTLTCNVSAGTAPNLLSVASRKAHGAAGTFDLPLSSAFGSPSVKP